MRTAAPREVATSASYDAAHTPAVSVVVATCNRAAFLPGLLASLAAQTLPCGEWEVVIADDGSADSTWADLRCLAAATPVRLLALRLDSHGGPSVPRNTAAAHARGAVLAFTDDDCLPTPEWLAHISAVATGGGLVQGRTLPCEDGPWGAWDRSIGVEAPSALFETCNLACRSSLFAEVGGFPTLRLLSSAPRGFGEDVAFGAAAAQRDGLRWAPKALVHHRWVAGTYRDHLAGRRRLVAFPALVGWSPGLRATRWHRLFLSRRTAATDLAVLACALAALHRRPWWLAGVMPWLALAWPEAGWRGGRSRVIRLAQLAVADAVASASLVEGSVRHRHLLL